MTMEGTIEDPVGAIALLDEPNRRRLYEFVVGSKAPVGRDESAAASGISRELAAFHLDRLVAAGLLKAEYRRLGARRGPGAGRPAKLYRRTERDLAVSLPPREYARAADILADALDRMHVDPAGPVWGTVADAARVRGEIVGVEGRRTAGSRPSRQRLRIALLDLLRRAGYEPEVVPDSGSICLRNCPYDALVVNHRDLTCGMNAAWAEGVMEGLGDSSISAILAPTSGCCCVVFEGTGTHHNVVARSGRARSVTEERA